MDSTDLSKTVNDSLKELLGSKDVTPPWASIVIRIIVCAVGVIGNLLVIVFVLALRQYKRASSHWYVLQLATADLVFLLTLPFKVSEDVNDAWLFSSGLCKAKETILFLNYYASILFLTIMSVDRYIAVCRTYPNFMKKFPFVAGVTIITWIISLVLCLPVILYSDVTGVDAEKCRCGYVFPKPKQTAEEWCVANDFITDAELADCITWAPVGEDFNACKTAPADTHTSEVPLNLEDPFIWELPDEDISGLETVFSVSCLSTAGGAWNAYVYFNFIAMFLIPFFIISTSYGLIGIRIKQTLMTASSRADRERKRITAMCAVLVCVFVVCWLPFHAVHLAKLQGISTSGESDICIILSVATSILAYLNAAINPYLYNFIGSFKKRLRQLRGKTTITSVKRNSAVLQTRSSLL